MTPDSSTTGASRRTGKLISLWLGGAATGLVLGGAAITYWPGLYEKLHSLQGGAEKGEVAAKKEAAAEEEAARKGFEMGVPAAGDPVRSISVTVFVGAKGAPLKEALDLHLGTGFPFRLYPLGTEGRTPAFAAFPQSSSLARGEMSIAPGESATFEFSAAGERGLDALNTTPQLLADLTVGDLGTIGFASRVASDWRLAGYRIEVNGELFAANDEVGVRPLETIEAAQAELQEAAPGFEALAQEVADLERFVETGLSDIDDRGKLAGKRVELEAARDPITGMLGKVTGFHPWFVERDPGFRPPGARAGPGEKVKSLKVTLRTGGGERPGSRNPVYFWASGKKYLLTSESDPLADEPAPQSFLLTKSDFETSPLTNADLAAVGIGMVGNEERFAAVPDRARLQRVVVEADGEEVFNSEKNADDRKTLGGIWLQPPAHFNEAGTLVDNASSPGEFFLWKAGTALAENANTGDDANEKEPDISTSDTAATDGTTTKPILKGIPIVSPTPPLRRVGRSPLRNFIGALIGAAARTLPVLVPATRAPVIGPPQIVATGSPLTSAFGPAPQVVRPGDTVTVHWSVTGPRASVRQFQVDLFAILPDRTSFVVSRRLARVRQAPQAGTVQRARLTIPNPITPRLIGVNAVQATQLYIRAVVTPRGGVGRLRSIGGGRPGSLVPLFPAGTNLPGLVLSPTQINFGRGSFFNGPAPPVGSFQVVTPVPGFFPPTGVLPLGFPPGYPGGAVGGPWISMAATAPFPGTPNVVWPAGLQPASNALVFNSPETVAIPAQGHLAYNTALRSVPGFVTMSVEGSVPYPSVNSGAAAAVNGYRVVGHLGFIGGSAPGATAAVFARVELNASAPLPRNLNDGLTDFTIPGVAGDATFASTVAALTGADFLGPFFTYQTATAINLANTPGAPLTLLDMPLRFNLLDAGGAAYPTPGTMGPPTGATGGPLNAADFAAYNVTKTDLGTVGVTVTIMAYPMTGAGPTTAVGLFGLRIVPDTSP